MRLARWITALLLPALLVSRPAGAVRVDVADVLCPLDGSHARAFARVSQDTEGGYDSDLCMYSSHDQWRQYALTTCPKDLFTLYAHDFTGPFDEDTLKRLREEAERAQRDWPDPDAIEIWDRYALAARFYAVLGKPQSFLGDLYLAASWTARDRAVGFYRGLEGPRAARELLELGEKELEKELEPAQRKTVLYNMARVAERYGDPELRDRYLDAFESQGELDQAEREALERFRRAVHEVEPRFQRLALQAYGKALESEELNDEARARLVYLCADLHRRLGEPGEASPLYRQVSDDEKAPEQLREMARFLLGELSR